MTTRFLTLVLSLALLAAAPTRAKAQMSNEAGTITALSVKRNFAPKFDACYRQELWSKDNMTNWDLLVMRLTVNYKPLSWLTLGAGYDHLSMFMDAAKKGGLEVDAYTRNTNRALAEVTGTLRIRKLVSISLRERYMFTYFAGASVPASREGVYEPWEASPSHSHVLRSRLTIACKIPDTKWSLYTGPEFFNSLNPGKKFALTQTRCYFGSTLKLSSSHSMRFYYCSQFRFNTGEIHHLLCMDYNITL